MKIQAGRTDNTRVDEVPGLLQFARVLIVVAGVWHVLIGFAAVQKDTVFVTSPGYTYAVDLTPQAGSTSSSELHSGQRVSPSDANARGFAHWESCSHA
jgi:hypothetical protein